jgi:hypothetical protein
VSSTTCKQEFQIQRTVVPGVIEELQPHLQASFGLTTHAQLQTMMFLQLVGGGQLLLFITRTENWFFQRPYPPRRCSGPSPERSNDGLPQTILRQPRRESQPCQH